MLCEFGLCAIILYGLAVSLLYIRKRKLKGHPTSVKVAFFHPFCNDGGGGEKVLWTMVQALLEECRPQATLQEYQSHPTINIYSLESNTQQIFAKVHQRFNIDLFPYAHRINIVHIRGRSLLVPQARLTMLFHIFLPMVYCLRCIWKYQPDIFYDTTGFAFNFLLVKALLPTTECRAYVHYPFISDDMVAKIRERKPDFNNDAAISRSWWKTQLKLAYYGLILLVYKSLRFAVSKAEANSTWTYEHMAGIWGRGKITKLFPPCSISDLLAYSKDYAQETVRIVSLAQFRPEKNHTLQIRVIQALAQSRNIRNIKLSICGTTRGADDEKILRDLQDKVKLLSLSPYIEFYPNLKYSDLLRKLQESHCGIHTMEAEHFGISIVEMLAAGILVVAHNSAGPRYDIIKQEEFLACSEQEYTAKLEHIIKLSGQQKRGHAQGFRKQMAQFGEEPFKENFRVIFHS